MEEKRKMIDALPTYDTKEQAIEAAIKKLKEDEEHLYSVLKEPKTGGKFIVCNGEQGIVASELFKYEIIMRAGEVLSYLEVDSKKKTDYNVLKSIRIRKFNQNHDRLGRFSSAGGGGPMMAPDGKGGGATAGALKKIESNEQYHNTIATAKEAQSENKRWRVDVHEAGDYEGCKKIVSEGGSCAAVTPDGDIISVCKNPNDKTVSGRDIMAKAVEEGGVKLDSFAGNHDFYVKCGFEAISATPFNEQYAPEGWKAGRDAPELVVAYKYVGKGNVKNVTEEQMKASVKIFEGENGYDEMIAFRDAQIGGK